MLSRFIPTLLLTLCGFGALQAAEVPRKSPEFAIPLPDGKEALVSQYRGKILCLVLVVTT